MKQIEKALKFKSLHVQGDPLVLYNIWDAGGAKALAESKAKACATSSWSIAAAHGFEDGETIPLEFVLQIVERIAKSVDVPLTVDFEGGYAVDPEKVTKNTIKVLKAGAIGINFEDQIVQGNGIYSITDQVKRIKAVRKAAEIENIPLFINARTDLFLISDEAQHETLIAEAIKREAEYAEAGADGFFIPGLTQLSYIERIVNSSRSPVNVMMMGKLNSIHDVADIGVARVSYGPGPYFNAISDLTDRYNPLR